jgi:hypothetical protein
LIIPILLGWGWGWGSGTAGRFLSFTDQNNEKLERRQRICNRKGEVGKDENPKPQIALLILSKKKRKE